MPFRRTISDQLVYGEEVKVQWLYYQRGEMKFSGADELVDQMKQDEQLARQNLQKIAPGIKQPLV